MTSTDTTACHAMTQDAHGFQHLCIGPAAHAGPHRNTHGYWPGEAAQASTASIQAPEGSDLAAAAAAEQDADARVDRAIEATEAARQHYREASAAYDLASEEQEAAVTAALEARRAHIAAMRAAGVAQTADGYVTR